MKRMIVALIFLTLAVGIIVLVNKVDLSTVGRGEATAAPTTAPQLFSVDPAAEVTRVQVKDNTTGSMVVIEKKDGKWVILEAPEKSDTGLGVDETRISNALTIMPSLMASRSMSGIEALATYGLGDEAKYTLTMLIGSKEYTLIIGSKNPGDTSYYVQLSGSSDVYLISTFSLDPVIELLSKPPYIQPTLDPNVTPSATPEESNG
jgi:hypothetical protein